MSSVTFTKFIDFVCKSGTPKLTVVRNWKHKADYDPAMDFYKRFRETVIEMHENDLDKDHLKGVLDHLTHKNKRNNYPGLISGYRKWMGRKDLEWFSPISAQWQFDSLGVVVNPELGLNIEGTPHLIKLYMKGDKLTKNRIDLATTMMHMACATEAPKDCVMGILDVRNSKLFTTPAYDPMLTTQLEGEAAYWCQVWNKV